MMFYGKNGCLYYAEMDLITTIWTVWHGNQVIYTNVFD